VSSEPTAAPREHVSLEGTTRAASPEIQKVGEDKGMAMLQGTVSGEAQALKLACTLWAATSESGNDAEDDEEVTSCNTLEHRLN
jgi:hypothetical protein